MKPETIRLEPSRFQKIRYQNRAKSDDAVRRTFMLSPYDTPEAVSLYDDGDRIRIDIRYVTNPSGEIRSEAFAGDGVRLHIEDKTDRVVGLSLEKALVHEELSVLLNRLASENPIEEDGFIHGNERSHRFRRAVLPVVLSEAAGRLSAQGSGEVRPR